MIICGDALAELKKLDDCSVQCCVTSPPYWGLRDYGVDGQLGLERTPEEYVSKLVAVFREVRRALRDDGTLWLNLGDSYHNGDKGGYCNNRVKATDSLQANHQGANFSGQPNRMPQLGLKPKDLVGIPWRVAFALQQPYYTGKIANERDRIWLAAMIDGEGCMFIHKRRAGQHNGQGYYRQNPSYWAGLEVANCSEAVVKRCLEIAGIGSICSQGPTENRRRKQVIYRWNARINECRDVIREVYPHLVAKQHQARLLLGCPSSGPEAEAAHVALMGLHNGIETSIDFRAPASLFEPGFYLRSDIIWKKSNPMPESVTDRPTKAHEYLFLMAKSHKYYYDSKAISEKASVGYYDTDFIPTSDKDLYSNKIGTSATKSSKNGRIGRFIDTRNRRSVWTISTHQYSEAHFAMFPGALVEPCIKAGCPYGGIILDPFFGAGTTGLVAMKLGREFIGIELNKKYCEMAEKRIYGSLGLKP